MFAPDSPWTLVLVVALAVTVLVLAVRFWRRCGWPLRWTAVLLVQVLVVAAVGLVLNDELDIATTWTALAGSSAGLDPAYGSGRDAANHWGRGPDLWRTSKQEKDVDRLWADRSQVRLLTLTGATTGYRLPARVYLPGSYFAPASKNRKFPVMELLPGYPGSELSWVHGLHAQSTFDRLIRTGKIPAAIAIFPSQNPQPPADSECVDSVGPGLQGSQAATYLTGDVRQYVTAHYRTAPQRVDWVIGGYSTGGYCAANLALHSPYRYAGVISLSGYFRGLEDETTGTLYADEAAKVDNSPLLTITRRHPPIAFFLGAAADDVSDSTLMREFQNAIPTTDDYQVETTATGGHTPPVWRTLSVGAITWTATALAR